MTDVKQGITVIPSQLDYRWSTILFFVGIHALAFVSLHPAFWSYKALGTLIILYWLTACIGVTLGYHRLLAHSSFSVPRWLEMVIATFGALSCQHGPIDWAGLHRHHHLHSDDSADHHNSNLGFWWSHLGWMCKETPAKTFIRQLTPDLRKVAYFRWLNQYFLLLQIPLAIALYLGGGWPLVLWGIPLRLVIVYHITWLVNSATHRWGYISYPSSNDFSRNNWWVALLTFGEGWHNNHHAYPNSARMGFKWWEIDLTWIHIKLLRSIGLANRIRLAKPLSYK